MSTPIGRTGLTTLSVGRDTPQAFRTPSPSHVVLFDDFLGDVLADQWNAVEGTDSATSSAAVVSGGIGGILRLTTGDAGTGLAADMEQVTSELNWRAANGSLVAETRVKLSAIADAYFFFGFTDVGTLEGPVVSAASDDDLTSNASNAVGFMFDTRMATDNLWAVGVKADTDATGQDLDTAFVADDFVSLRVEVASDGSAAFFINGVQVGDVMEDAVTTTTALTPTINLSKVTGASSITADVDYVYVAMARAANEIGRAHV